MPLPPRDRELLERTRFILVQDLQYQDGLYAAMRSKYLLNIQQGERLKNMPISAEKGEALIDVLLAGDEDTMETFVWCLSETGQQPLVNYMRREAKKLQKAGAAVSPTARSLNTSGMTSNPGKSSYSDARFIPACVTKLNPQDFWVQEALKDSEVYPMCNSPRGTVVIVNNELFSPETRMSDRDGSSMDAVNLSSLFEQLDYTVDVWKDYDAEELLNKVKDVAKSELHHKTDAFFMFILSHGVRGYVYDKHGQQVLIADIVTQFNSRNCVLLKGKPKLFFIQACQGVEKIEGVQEKSDCDSCSSEMLGHLSDLCLTDGGDKTPITLPEGPLEGNEMEDIYIVYATAPGHKAWRNIELGTWFIREFILVCNEFAHKEEIKEILRMVRTRVKAHLSGKGMGMIPPSVDYLEKKFYFMPGI